MSWPLDKVEIDDWTADRFAEISQKYKERIQKKRKREKEMDPFEITESFFKKEKMSFESALRRGKECAEVTKPQKAWIAVLQKQLEMRGYVVEWDYSSRYSMIHWGSSTPKPKKIKFMSPPQQPQDIDLDPELEYQ